MKQKQQALQSLYQHTEIKKNCQPINFTFAFVIAIASSHDEVPLQQWLPLLHKNNFSDEKIATEFALMMISLLECVEACSQNDEQLPLMSENWFDEQGEITLAASDFAKGYLSAMQLIDDTCTVTMNDLTQTCLLLLSKLAGNEKEDAQLQVLFAQLPSVSEIANLLPELLSAQIKQSLQGAPNV